MTNLTPTPPRNPLSPVWGLFGILMVGLAIVSVVRFFSADDIIPWRTNLESARAESEQSNKPLFLYFTADWCGPCQTMRRTTWADATVERALQNYIPVKINIDQNPTLARQYQADAIPLMLILDNNGKIVKEMNMYLPPEDLLAWVNR